MKKILFLLCLVAMSASAKVRTTETNYADTIRIKYVNGQILLPVTIAGNTYDFVYDTGANMSTIPDSLAESLILKMKKSRSVSDFDNNKQKVARGILAEMTIGHLHLNGVETSASAGSGFVLGAYQLYLSGFSCKIDLMHGIIILTDRKQFFANDKQYLLPEKDFGFMTQLKFSMSHGCRGSALFDTGYNSFFAISRKLYDESANGANGKEFLDQELWTDTATYAGAHGIQKSVQSTLWMEEIKIGDVSFHNVPVSTTDNYSGFGCRMLEYGAMVQERMTKCYFEPYIEGAVIQMIQPKPQVNIGLKGDQVIVHAIDTRSQLYSDGVRVGDVIEQINGQPSSTVEKFAAALGKIDIKQSCPLLFRHPDGTETSTSVGPQTYGYFFHM